MLSNAAFSSAGLCAQMGRNSGSLAPVKRPKHAEEIFEPFACERVALHVEEEVAVIGRRKHREAAAPRARQQFKGVLAVLAGVELKPGLGRQLGDGLRAHALDFRGG